jgi:glycosyltransferase involved in cell wall biosynthesis
MSEKPLVSVIIPSYNSAGFVVPAVESAFAQTYSPVEVIVVDDGSTDNTRERLVPWNDRVRYVYQPNGGLSKARNRGIKEARGDLIAFLDADDQWLPSKLDKQWERLRTNPQAPLVHTDLYQLREPAGDRVYAYRNRGRFSGHCYAEFFSGNSIVPSTVMITRRCLEEVGRFDEEIRGASTQDFDLWFRVARHFPLSYVGEPLVLYRQHPTNASRNQRMMLEDEYYVLAKALQADPALCQVLGQGRVRRRMSELAFQAGYANADTGDLLRARRYFRAALGYAPQRLTTWVFWASTFLPPGLRQRLRRVKQQLGAAEVSSCRGGPLSDGDFR